MRTLAQNKYIHFLQGGSGGGVNSPKKPKKCIKMVALRFYSKNYILDAKIYLVMMWIQIHSRGEDFFSLNRFNTAHSECSQIQYYQPKNQQF